jgi:hypothetical protein
LIRTPAKRQLVATVTAHELTGTATHWYNGRTVPCENEVCQPCLDGVPWRWHAYVACVIHNSTEHVLLEITAQATEQFLIYQKAYGTLRGCMFQASRDRERPNGRVIIQCKPTGLKPEQIPPEPNVEHALSILWNLPQPQVRVAENLRDQRHVTVERDGNGRPRDPYTET